MTPDKDAYDILHSERLVILPQWDTLHICFVAEPSIVAGAERGPWMTGIDHLSRVMSEKCIND